VAHPRPFPHAEMEVILAQCLNHRSRIGKDGRIELETDIKGPAVGKVVRKPARIDPHQIARIFGAHSGGGVEEIAALREGAAGLVVVAAPENAECPFRRQHRIAVGKAFGGRHRHCRCAAGGPTVGRAFAGAAVRIPALDTICVTASFGGAGVAAGAAHPSATAAGSACPSDRAVAACVATAAGTELSAGSGAGRAVARPRPSFSLVSAVAASRRNGHRNRRPKKIARAHDRRALIAW
jgi:hypothetical protein